MLRVLSLLDNDRSILLVPEAKPRDTNMPKVSSLIDNDRSTLLVSVAKPRDSNNMLLKYYFYVAYVLHHYLSLSNSGEAIRVF